MHPKSSSWKRKKKKNKRRKTKRNKTKEPPSVVSFTTHSQTFKSAPARRGNPIRVMLSLSIPGSAGPRSRVTCVYEPGAASRGTAPLRPWSRCAHGPRDPLHCGQGPGQHPPATRKPGGMAEQHRNHLFRTVCTYPSILAVCFYAANVSAGISQLQTSVKLKGSRGGHSQRSKNALLEARM